MSESEAFVRTLLADAIAAHERFAQHGAPSVAAAALAISQALRAGNKVLVFGNGGSAADAQHFAAELVGRFEQERTGLAAIALTTDSSAITAIANDYGFDQIFVRQIAGLGQRGDIAFGISTSGASANVVAALEAARAAGLVPIALTGRDGGAAGVGAAVHINVGDASTARVQEVHITVLHAICGLIDREFS